MAKKLSTLIIDAVVNTSQIDQAANRINSKLKGVGGSGSGNYGGGRGGAFSSGVVPYGNTILGSGASSAAAAAAIGAGAAVIARGNVSRGFAKQTQEMSWRRQKLTDELKSKSVRRAYRSYREAYRTNEMMGGRDFEAAMDLEEAAKDYGAAQRNQRDLESKRAAVQRGMRRRALGTGIRRGMRSAAAGISGIGLAKGAGAVSAVALAANQFTQTEAAMDEYNYIGKSGQFNVAKQIRQRNDAAGTKRLGFSEAAVMGANVGEGKMSKIIGNIDDFFKTSMAIAAAAPEIMTNPFGAFAVMEVASPSSAAMVTTVSSNAKRNNI